MNQQRTQVTYKKKPTGVRLDLQTYKGLYNKGGGPGPGIEVSPPEAEA